MIALLFFAVRKKYKKAHSFPKSEEEKAHNGKSFAYFCVFFFNKKTEIPEMQQKLNGNIAKTY